MDSDLSDSLSALKACFQRRHIPANFTSSSEELISELKAKLRLTRRYRTFLLEANPSECETRTPSERVQLLRAEELLKEQEGFALQDGDRILRPRQNGWRS